MRLIIGLGNPGKAYGHNRHNLGFMVVEELARRLGLVFREGESAFAVAEDDRITDPLFLLKPMTYMNRSGEATLAWSRQAGVAVTGSPPVMEIDPASTGDMTERPQPAPPEAVRPLVVCDDLNLPLGSVRVRPSGSSGGQNGLASLIEHLGGEEFPRLRLGIAPLEGGVDPEAWPDFVTADFEVSERTAAEDLVNHAASALEFWLNHGLEPTISRFNRRIRLEPE
jgi:PTH1 family peptidyl-tRNA hydrolase